MSEAAKQNLLLVADEELFIDVLQRFPPRRYPLAFASTLMEAQAAALDKKPKLVLLPITDPAAAGLGGLLDAAAKVGAKVLAIKGDAVTLPEALAARVNKVCGVGVDAVLEASAELLGERRSSPRVAVEIPVKIAGKEMKATIVSGKSLFVPTEAPLARGRMVKVQVEGGGDKFNCWAKVLRVGPGEHGDGGMVLGVPERDTALRGYLEGVVRSSILLARADDSASGAEPLSPELSRQLVRRVQVEVGALRETLNAQIGFTDALSQRLDALGKLEEKAVKWETVGPLLAQKLSAQRKTLQALVDRVEGLSADRGAADELRDALQQQAELQTRVEQQQATIGLLRERVDELQGQLSGADDSAPHAVAPAGVRGGEELRRARTRQQLLERTVAQQAEMINELARRVELATQQSAQPELLQAQRRIDEQGEQLANLSALVVYLQDELRLGRRKHVDAFSDEVERRGRALAEQTEAAAEDDWEAMVDAAMIVTDDEPTAPGFSLDEAFPLVSSPDESEVEAVVASLQPPAGGLMEADDGDDPDAPDPPTRPGVRFDTDFVPPGVSGVLADDGEDEHDEPTATGATAPGGVSTPADSASLAARVADVLAAPLPPAPRGRFRTLLGTQAPKAQATDEVTIDPDAAGLGAALQPSPTGPHQGAVAPIAPPPLQALETGPQLPVGFDAGAALAQSLAAAQSSPTPPPAPSPSAAVAGAQEGSPHDGMFAEFDAKREAEVARAPKPTPAPFYDVDGAAHARVTPPTVPATDPPAYDPASSTHKTEQLAQPTITPQRKGMSGGAKVAMALVILAVLGGGATVVLMLRPWAGSGSGSGVALHHRGGSGTSRGLALNTSASRDAAVSGAANADGAAAAGQGADGAGPGSAGAGSGSGAGDGDGSGSGTGDGDGSGSGDGDGSGSGSGDGDGSGSGVGDGTGSGSGSVAGAGTGDGTGDGDGSGTAKKLTRAERLRALRRRRRERKRRLRWWRYKTLREARRYLARGKYVKARKPLNRVLKQRDDYVVRELMARSHAGARELWPAAYHYRKAIASAPASVKPRLQYRTAMVYFRLGKKGRACKYLRAAAGAAKPFAAAVKLKAKRCR